MFLEEQHARPCNNYRSTGIQIRLLSVMFPIHGNVERTGSLFGMGNNESDWFVVVNSNS